MGVRQITTGTDQYIVFRLGEQQHALLLSAVERVIRAVAITPLPKAPPPILGIVNLQGSIIPVASLRKLCGLEDHDLEISDQFIIARAACGVIALVVDAVIGVQTCAEHSIVAASDVLPGLDSVRAVAGKPTSVPDRGGITILHDVDQLLGWDTVAQLDTLQINGNAPVGESRKRLR